MLDNSVVNVTKNIAFCICRADFYWNICARGIDKDCCNWIAGLSKEQMELVRPDHSCA